jgi:glycosyltransferase involved in cell wall biosynthesis
VDQVEADFLLHGLSGSDRVRSSTTPPAAMTGLPVLRIGICVPARNEADSIIGCVQALARAATLVDCRVLAVIVADRCTDDTAELARQAASASGLPTQVLSVQAGSVGAARAVGMSTLISRLGVAGSWLATTDADSRVPPDWLTGQLRYARAGAELVVGTVDVSDWSAHSAQLRAYVAAEYARRRDPTHGHVHGANLGFAASAYRRVGGFTPVTAHEDVLLVRAAERLGLVIRWAEDLPVNTSARLVARAPAGFAHYLSLASLALLAVSPDRVDGQPARSLRSSGGSSW